MSREKWIFEKEKLSPNKKLKWVKIVAHIKCVLTGEIAKYENKGIWDEENQMPHTYIWEEGNFSCDCNRKMFFLSGLNRSEPSDEEIPCGGGKYLVNLENPQTSEIFYREYDD